MVLQVLKFLVEPMVGIHLSAVCSNGLRLDTGGSIALIEMLGILVMEKFLLRVGAISTTTCFNMVRFWIV